MFKIVLKRKDEVVGNLGEYDDISEAKSVCDGYNTKPSRRGAIAEIVEIKKNPSSLGALFGSDDSYDEDSVYIDMESEESEESEYSEESEESEVVHEPEEQDSEDYSTEKISVYKNPLDLWPIDQPKRIQPQKIAPKKNVPRRESITKNRKRLTRKFKAPYSLSVQAIMIDDDGYVLIRKPSNRYRGIKWEFYGGKVDGGEDIEEALRREMLEETGYTINLVDKIGEVSIDGGIQKYFLISPQTQVQEPTMETEDTFWVSQDEAWNQLGKNKEPYKRKLRSILDQAYSIWRRNNV
jgi:8-oxo-dGTP diphosphatase